MKTAILIPTYVSVDALLFGQFIFLAQWATQQNIPIITVANRTHNDARNWLATGGGGFENSNQLIEQVDQLVWIDSDQVFKVEQLQTLIECEEKFCSGWYVKETPPMVARWDEDFFVENSHMDFLSIEELEDAKELLQVDYCGFGFTKTHTDILKKMEYPFFRNKLIDIHIYKENASEDVSFCLDAYEATGIKPMVLPELRVGHCKSMVI